MPETAAATAPVEAFTVTDDEARKAIVERIPLATGERLDIRRITECCFRVNVWEVVPEGVIDENRIANSFFVTIKPDEVLIE